MSPLFLDNLCVPQFSLYNKFCGNNIDSKGCCATTIELFTHQRRFLRLELIEVLTIQTIKILKKSVVLVLVTVLLIPIVGLTQDGSERTTILQTESNGEVIENWELSTTDFLPTRFADPIYDADTSAFIDSTRDVPENNASSIEQIYYQLATIRILDPSLTSLPSTVSDFWISQVLSFQRTSGGFGDWLGDRSSVSATQRALQILDWLGYVGLNVTLVGEYLDRLQNSLTDGYNSYLLDTDSDVHSTYHAIKSYQLIGSSPSNVTAVSDFLKRAQNPDGGFGLQTNNKKGIYWTSKITVTQDAIEGLAILAKEADNPQAALSFVQGLQLISSGGYVNDVSVIATSASYTSSALDTIYALAGTPINITSAAEYLHSLETVDGGFRLKPTSTVRSLMGTYYAVYGLSLLGHVPAYSSTTLNYVLNPSSRDGYGGTPGEVPSLRETFDAVYAQMLMGNYPSDVQGITDYIESYRNPDGGFGLTGSFTESTLRVAETYNLLGIPFPNPSETISFLKGLQLPNGGFVKFPGDTTAYIVSTYRAIRALEILGSHPDDVSGAISFIQGIQNGDGGFGGFLGDTSDVTSTYRAIRALNILGSSATSESAVGDFLTGSQNPDGGFRRGLLDTALPKNISNTIFTYSAIRALSILDLVPNDVAGVYSFVTSVQNFDGGYAEHPAFTSNIAYTFVSLYILRNFHYTSDFRISIPDDLDTIRFDYDSAIITINGLMGNLEYSITNTNSLMIMNAGVLISEGNVAVDTSSLSDGTYTLEIFARDPTGAEVLTEVTLLISRSETPTSTTTSAGQTDSTGLLQEPLVLILAMGGFAILIVLVSLNRKRA